MINPVRHMVVLALLVSFCAAGASAQSFGKNKVQYRSFDWKVVKTENFDIYFYEGEDEIVRFAQQMVEDAYEKMRTDLNHKLRSRVPIIIYNSQNDFQQTNVILDLIEESVGGFTELYKNRVVVPFTGSYEDFRHVLVHELTHAIEFDLLFGGSMGSIFSSSLYTMNLPLWVFEGLSEFMSLGWDEDSDMFMRDLVVNREVVSIPELAYSGGYVIYKEGQSIYHFIAEKYGRKKIGELLHRMRMSGGLEGAVRSSLGVSLKQLDEDWRRHLKKKYWPLLSTREEIVDVGRRLTDHVNEGGVYNTGPALSPDGDKVAFMSDRSGKVDVLVASAIDGKILKRLVRGGSSNGFESMHIQRASLSFSPDGNSLTFAAKAGSGDRLYVVNALNGRIEKQFGFDMDGLFSPSFSPDGTQLVFVGLSDGYSDIYVVDIETGSLERVTEDRFDDRDPSWSKDGQEIVFCSDRPDTLDNQWAFGEYAVFLMSLDGAYIRRVSDRSTFVASPQIVDGEGSLFFVSDICGTKNLYYKPADDSASVRLTNVLGGVFSVTASSEGDKIVVSSYRGVGWDLFLVKEPLKLQKESQEPFQELAFRDERFNLDGGLPEREDVGLDFSPDWVSGGVSYSTEYGFAGETEIAVSDVLGNHRIYFSSDFFGNVVDSNFNLTYYYLPRRIDFGGAIFQQKEYYVIDYGSRVDVLSERTLGIAGLASYPLDRFNRVETELDAIVIADKYQIYELGRYGYEETGSFDYDWIYVITPSISYVHDTSMWGITGPVSGSRIRLGVGKSLPFVHPTYDYGSVFADVRKYLMLTKRHNFALRLVAATSFGPDANAATYWIGGSQTIRGYDDYQFHGTQIAFVNAEFRYPFVDRLKLGFPLPLDFRSVRGALFVDAGAATDNWRQFKLSESTEEGYFRLKDLKLGFGMGVRMNISFLVMKLDMAKRTDLNDVSSETRWYFTLGSEF